MRKYVISFVLLLSIVVTTILRAEEPAEIKKLGVLPFTIHSSENLDYIRNGVWDMLISRLSSAGGVTVADKAAIAAVLQGRGKEEMTAADVYEVGRRLDLDYVVWGSITKIGSSVSLDGRLFDISASQTPISVYEQTRGMDDVIPKINDFARKVSAYVKGEEAAVASTTPRPATPPVTSPRPVEQREPEEEKARIGEPTEVLRSERGTLTSVINPSFIMTPDILDREGFFMSPRYPRKFVGMDVGDVNGDGGNEVVVIDKNNIYIYRVEDNKGFVLKKTISGRSYDTHITVDVADINRNGTPEIIVTNMRLDRVNSFIMEYRDGEYNVIAEDLRWLLRVIETSDGPCLLGQRLGMTKPFENPIYEIVGEGDEYRESRRMPIPQGLAVFSVTLASLDGGLTERVIALDEYDHLNVYQKTSKPLHQIHVLGRGGTELLWRSNESYGGSDNLIPFVPVGSGGDDTRDATMDNVYANVRILTHDLIGNGKEEVILVNNLSPVGRLLRNVKVFNRAELYGFEWDGMGLMEKWKTRTIQGYVTDYHFKDMNNDGRKQIVMALVLSTAQSVIVAYDLNI